ncbi:3-beta-glucanosyltransferase gel4 [Striga asiatica]|uniref:3-beta-glucanosyltransferase gel4 n=1 Tax=Striga asiatica TaxID=4170 RepID=A0A5A7PGX5_STRAF|nr:3-beta-glucanosyltransferase gel4 [Striga asiatica]
MLSKRITYMEPSQNETQSYKSIQNSKRTVNVSSGNRLVTMTAVAVSPTNGTSKRTSRSLSNCLYSTLCDPTLICNVLRQQLIGKFLNPITGKGTWLLACMPSQGSCTKYRTHHVEHLHTH